MNEIKAGSEDDRLHGSTSARLVFPLSLPLPCSLAPSLSLPLCAATIKRICIRDNSLPDECPVSASRAEHFPRTDERAESSARSKRPNCRVLRIY